MTVRGTALGIVCGIVLLPCAFALNPALDVSQYAHTAWLIRDGFTKGAIHAIAQTPDGYLWLGTELGLLRFDGVRNLPWQPPRNQRLPSNFIFCLLAARDGTLWIGTLSGLASWKGGTVTRYAEFDGLAIIALVEDHEGAIWVGGNGPPEGKLCEIRGTAVQCHPEIGPLGHGVTGMHEDRQGNLWVGLLAGVWRWKPGPPQFYAIPGEVDGIQGMADEVDGGLLISMNGGPRRLVDGKPQMAYPLPISMREFQSRRVLRDRDGGLWIGTSGGGLAHVHQGRTDVLSQADGLSGDVIAALFEDREGSIWVPTLNGLDRFRELPVVTYTTKQGLFHTPTSGILGTKDGSVWFGTQNGLDRLNNGQVSVYRQQGSRTSSAAREIAISGLPNNGFTSLLQDSRQRIWVSTLSEIGYLENDRFIRTTVPGGVVHALAEDSFGNLWIANQNMGVFELSPRNEVRQIPWTTFGHQGPAYALNGDPSRGGLWLGFSQGGVSYFDGDQVRTSYTTADGLAEGRVSELRFDGEGALWAATAGGLSRLSNGRIATLTSRNGLPCDAVQWTMEDDAGSVWLNMPCGLVRIARSELDRWAAAPDKANTKIQHTMFDSSDGVRSTGLAGGYSPHVAKSPDGKLWFYTPGGISMVDPRHLPANPLRPPVEIEKITADRKTYWESLSGQAPSNPRLPPLARDLQIDYTALSMVAPEKVYFRVKLEGHDPDWKDMGTERKAFYNDLPPRHYRFRVMACNNSGVWNEAGASFEFFIDPAYYQTAWFQVSCVAAFLGLLWALHRLRLHQVAHEFNARLEERLAERTRIARDLHDTLLQSFHGLMYRYQAARNMFPRRPEEAMEALDSALEQTEHALAEGRDAIHDLRASTTVTNEIAQAVTAFGQEMSHELSSQGSAHGSLRFHVVVEGQPRDLHPILRDEVYAIVCEAVRNAFRHAQAHVIEAQITYHASSFQLRIRDDGKGIDPAIVAEGRPGHYGVPGMRERARRIGGKLDVWTASGAGTEVELSIPASIAYGTSPGRSVLRLFRKKTAHS
jgi:signal transduction histidine kinase/ligand-binding sensor domain-containing protein